MSIRPGISLLLLTFLTLTLLLPAPATQQKAQEEDPYVAGGKAYREKNYPAYLHHLLRIQRQLPNNQGILARLAGAYALTGQKNESVKTLRSIAAMGGTVDLSQPDFKALAGTPELASVIAAFARNREPTNRSRVAFRLPERDLIPEGIAYDEGSGDFFVGSIHRSKIVGVSKGLKVTDFVAGGQYGIREVLGMRVDAKRRVLWACASYAAPRAGPTPVATVFQFALPTGKLISQYPSQTGRSKHLFNDIVPLPSGDVLLTDSEAGSVLRISRGSKTPEVLIADRTFIYPNGIDVTPDARSVFVADQKGIHRYDMASGKLQELRHPQNVSVAGLDGMYWYRGSLIGVQNGFEPARIVRIWLEANHDSVSRLEVLESNHSLFDIPTTGTLAGDQFYFIANSQLEARDQKGKIAQPDKLKEPVVLGLKL